MASFESSEQRSLIAPRGRGDGMSGPHLFSQALVAGLGDHSLSSDGAARGAWSAPTIGSGAKPGGTSGQGGNGAGTSAATPRAEATVGEEGGVRARGPVTEEKECGDGGWLLPEEDMAEKGGFLDIVG